ncbi:metalloregulator ArsR/SmtB family transcription factor [bacterium]|nr:metalloregulator ArsR/SmtB family transcription factor [bacterium]
MPAALTTASPDDETLFRAIKALADPHRLSMMRAIAEAGEMACAELVERSPLSQATVSHHLKILVESELVTVRREGQFGFFRLNGAIANRVLSEVGEILSPKRARGQKTRAAK